MRPSLHSDDLSRPRTTREFMCITERETPTHTHMIHDLTQTHAADTKAHVSCGFLSGAFL